jgi:hypothetical protein
MPWSMKIKMYERMVVGGGSQEQQQPGGGGRYACCVCWSKHHRDILRDVLARSFNP